MNNQMSKKKRYTLLFAFVAVVLAVMSLFITVTYSMFGDVKSGDSGNIEIATLDFEVTSTMAFPSTILPNTQYTGADYSNAIKNTGNSREIFVRVKLDSSLTGYIEPIYDTSKWAVGGQYKNEYYYLGVLAEGQSVTFNTGFRTLNNFTNDIAGNTFNVRLTVYALQAQYRAFEDTNNGWKNTYTPSAFTTYYNSVKDTYK